MQTELFYVGTTDDRHIRVNSASEIDVKTFNSYEEAVDYLPVKAALLEFESRRLSRLAGEVFDPNDPGDFHIDDLRVLTVTIDNNDATEIISRDNFKDSETGLFNALVIILEGRGNLQRFRDRDNRDVQTLANVILGSWLNTAVKAAAERKVLKEYERPLLDCIYTDAIIQRMASVFNFALKYAGVDSVCDDEYLFWIDLMKKNFA